MPSGPSHLIAALARDQINLDLKTLELCVLTGLYLRVDRKSLASCEEDVLIDLFEQVRDVVDPRAALSAGSAGSIWGRNRCRQRSPNFCRRVGLAPLSDASRCSIRSPSRVQL